MNNESFFSDGVILKVSDVFCKKKICNSKCMVYYYYESYIVTRLRNSVTCKNDLYLIEIFENRKH
jgi:hypothetical protein